MLVSNQEVKGAIAILSIHLDIKDGKIWIQWNSTDVDIGQELVDLGVDKQDIVLGFQPQYMRKYTDYAVS